MLDELVHVCPQLADRAWQSSPDCHGQISDLLLFVFKFYGFLCFTCPRPCVLRAEHRFAPFASGWSNFTLWLRTAHLRPTVISFAAQTNQQRRWCMYDENPATVVCIPKLEIRTLMASACCT